MEIIECDGDIEVLPESRTHVIRAAIVDENALVRRGLQSLLSSCADIACVAEASGGTGTLPVLRRARPDIVLLDAALTGIDGSPLTTVLRRDVVLADTRVLLLGGDGQVDAVVEALRAGAGGFILKDDSTDQVVDAVRLVAAGGSVLSPELINHLIHEVIRRPTRRLNSDHLLAGLTGRERDVFHLLARGFRNDEIAKLLCVGDSTVKSHVQRLYEKLGLRDRAQLIVFAYERGLVSPEGDGEGFPPGGGESPRNGGEQFSVIRQRGG